MTFSKSRFFSISLVVCVLLSLTFTFVSASSESISFDVFYEPSEGGYIGFLDDVQASFFESAFNSSLPLAFSFDGVDSLVTDPSNYFLQSEFEYPVFHFSIDPIIMLIQLSDSEYGFALVLPYNDVPSISVSVSVVSGSDPGGGGSGELLSDLRLTGTAFLETVQGVVLSIVKNPLLLLTVGIFFFGGCVTIFGRLLSKD